MLWRTLVFDSTHLKQAPAPAMYKEYFVDSVRLQLFNYLKPIKLSTALYIKVPAFELSTLRNLVRSEDPEGLSAQIQTLLELAMTKKARKLLPYGRSDRSNSLSRGHDLALRWEELHLAGVCSKQRDRILVSVHATYKKTIKYG
jgi:hypothetical protein